MFAGVFISAMFPQSPISHISAQFIQLKYRIPYLMKSFPTTSLHIVCDVGFFPSMLHESRLLWFGPYVRCLGSICEFAVDGWEKLFGTNSTSFQPKWATARNFNGSNMRNVSLESRNQRELPCTFPIAVLGQERTF